MPPAAPNVRGVRIRIIDAFTDRPFAGNPAGVCLLDTPTAFGTHRVGVGWPGRVASGKPCWGLWRAGTRHTLPAPAGVLDHEQTHQPARPHPPPPRRPDRQLPRDDHPRHPSPRVREFANLLTQRHGQDLADWIANTCLDALPGFDSYLNGLEKDWDATVAGLTLPYSNGPTEGVNTKIKLLKRQTYGKAGFALLRKRILLA